MPPCQIDSELARKYSVAGPRYTSYPPATCFTDKVTRDLVEAEMAENNQSLRDLSLYFHIPFCYSLCWYCGCTTVITTQQSQSALYLDNLKRELALAARYLNPKRKVVQVHLGGGTPTFMTPDELRTLGQMIRGQFQLADDVEASVELEPRRLQKDHLVALRESGFNRVSMGVQDFNPKVQEAVHRIQPLELTLQVMEWIRELKFNSLNIDLIYGLPYQTVESFEKTLDTAIQLGPDRLAVFNYAHVPWLKPAQKILEKDALPTADVKLQLLNLVIRKLTGEGHYVYIGMDHFARPQDELALAQKNKTLHRNFQGYSTRGDADMYAFGMSSISKTDNAYWQNEKELQPYYTALQNGKLPIAKGYFLTNEDKIRRATIMQLMCNLGLDYATMSKRLGIDFAKHFAPELASLGDLEADGMLKRSDTAIEITELGRLFIRNIAMRFDPYLPKESERRFSKTV
jgi:oxygen-independent coproporphyrinogen III oxidase